MVVVRLDELDLLVGGLPASARRHAAWWANSRESQPHARFWLDAGRRAQVDFASGCVRFSIGAESPDLPRTRRQPASPKASRSGAADDLTMGRQPIETTVIALWFAWVPLGEVRFARGRPVFPAAPRRPGVYRFRLSHPSAATTHYIGETDNLARRMGNYRSPGPAQPTSKRIHRRLVETLDLGGQVFLDVIAEAEADGKPLDLAFTADRRLIENAALVGSRDHGTDVENL